MDTDTIDTSTVDQARSHAEQVEAEARRAVTAAHADYGRAVAALVNQHGATAVARALDISRGRVYQLIAKADPT